MPKNIPSPFPSPSLQVIIPYTEYERLLSAVSQIPILEAKYARLEEQFVAYRGMFAECMEELRNVKAYVSD